MRSSCAVVCAVGLIRLGATAEFRIGHQQCVVPAIEFLQGILQGEDTFCKLSQQIGMRAGLVLMGVKTAER